MSMQRHDVTSTMMRRCLIVACPLASFFVGKVVAFSAYLDHTLSNLQKNQVIVFNRILLNEGEGYDTTSGVFTCPRTGVYLATFFVGK